MAERKAVNKYYPPDWNPSKGSLNKHVGQHPLRDRARKLGQGILVIRFEMPFNAWCAHCNQHIAMGIRYNAEKKKIGQYFSTPLYSFLMKCHMCGGLIEIHTDPKNSEYVIVSGATKKHEIWTPESNEAISLINEKKSEKLANNPFFKIENTVHDLERAQSSKSSLDALEKAQERIWKDDYKSSRIVRYYFRNQKKESQNDLSNRTNLGDLILLEETKEDVQKSKEAFSSVDRVSRTTPTLAQITTRLKKRRLIK